MRKLIDRNPDIAWRDEPDQKQAILDALERGEEASEQGWVILMDSGMMHELNLVAGEIWVLADGTRTENDIAEALAEKYDASPEEILFDIKTLLAEFTNNGWLLIKDDI